MTTRIHSAAGLAVLAGIVPAGAASAASGATATAAGNTAGKVVIPIVLTHTAGAALSFGTFTNGTGGKLTVAGGKSGGRYTGRHTATVACN
jgi:hypothetical protein